MRFFRRVVIAIFIASLAVYAGTNIYENKTTDTDPPQITSDTEVLEISVESDEDALLEGLTAYDNKDGDLTDSIMVYGKSFFTEKGTLTVDYVVFDSDYNVASFSRKVCYTDYTSPEFAVDEVLYFGENTSEDIEDYVTAVDVLDGDITDSVRVDTSELDTETAGTYTVTFSVTNSYGDTSELEVYVTIGETSRQYGVILKSSLVYIDKGSSFDAEEYIDKYISSQGEELDVEGLSVYEDGYYVLDVDADSDVDTKTPGTYTVKYSWSTSSTGGSAYLTVVVRE